MRLLSRNEEILFKVNYFIKKRCTHTVTETTIINNANNETAPLTALPNVNPPASNPNPNLLSESGFIEKLKENNSSLDQIINRPKPAISEVKESNKIQEMHSDGNDSAEEKPKSLAETISQIEQVPSTATTADDISTEIETCMSTIKASTHVLAHTITENLVKRNINLQESEDAEKRQENLYSRIREFVKSFGVKKSIITISTTLAVGYTLYYLVRYRQIPFGGFIKGMFTGAANAPSEISSNIVGPTNNITITMPSNTPEAVRVVQPGLANTMANFVENLNPTTIFLIGTILWLLKKRA